MGIPLAHALYRSKCTLLPPARPSSSIKFVSRLLPRSAPPPRRNLHPDVRHTTRRTKKANSFVRKPRLRPPPCSSLLFQFLRNQHLHSTPVLQEKGHAFAENSAQVLRTAKGASLKGAVLSAVDVALSAKPDKVLKTVDAGLDMLSTCDANALKKAVVTSEKATAQAISADELIPDDATIDEVVDAAASVAATCNAGALSNFAKTATDAATSIDGGKLMGLTASAAKVGLSSDKAALAAATAAAGDLVLSLR